MIIMFTQVGENLSVYVNDYEIDFLKASKEHFERKANEGLADLALPDYMRMVQKTLAMEEKRVDEYMHSTTNPKLKKLVVECMLAEPMQTQLLSKAGSSLECQLDNAMEEAKSGGTTAMQNLALIYQMVGLVDNDGNGARVLFLYNVHVHVSQVFLSSLYGSLTS